MKTTIITIIILLAVGLGIYFVVSSNNNAYQTPATDTGTNTYTPPATPDTQTVPMPNNTPPATTPTNPATPTPVAPASVSVNIQGFAFSPATLTIKKGTTVTWTNEDSVAHTVTSDSGSTLNSPMLSQGASFSFTFNTPGTFTYHCAVHPMMTASVVVTN